MIHWNDARITMPEPGSGHYWVLYRERIIGCEVWSYPKGSYFLNNDDMGQGGLTIDPHTDFEGHGGRHDIHWCEAAEIPLKEDLSFWSIGAIPCDGDYWILEWHWKERDILSHEIEVCQVTDGKFYSSGGYSEDSIGNEHHNHVLWCHKSDITLP